MPYVPPHRKAALEAAAATGGSSTTTTTTGTSMLFRGRQQQATAGPEPEDMALQKQRWKKLSSGIISAINKTSKTSVLDRAVDIIRFNIERGKGVFCKALMRSQEANPEMSDLFAALASVINRQFPAVGQLLLKRLLIQWRRYCGRKNADGIKNEGRFIAQLYIFGVCSDSVVLELLIALLCQDPQTDLEIDAASSIFKESYRVLEMRNPKAFHEILSLMRDSLQADPKTLSKRSESIVEAMLDDVKQWRRSKRDTSFVDINLLPILEGNAEAEMEPHEMSLDDPAVAGEEGSGRMYGDPETHLDNFSYDKDYAVTENSYEEIKRIILGPLADEPAPDPAEDGEDVGDWSEDENDLMAVRATDAYSTMPKENANATGDAKTAAPAAAANTSAKNNGGNTNASGRGAFSSRMAGATSGAINTVDDLRKRLDSLFSPTNSDSPFTHEEDIKIRTRIVTAIQSSISAEEAAHKLMKGMVKGSEALICYLVTEACAQEPIYREKHALIAAQLCGTGGKMQYFWSMLFKYRYYTADSLDVAPLLVNARIFAHLLATRSISWECMEVADLATSDASQRIFIGNVLTHICEFMSIPKVMEQLKNSTLQSKLTGLFPVAGSDIEKERRAIRFFESLGLEQLYVQQRQLGMKRGRE